MGDQERIAAKYERLRPFLDERRRRVWAAAEATALGRGGVTMVAAATGLRRNTISVGMRELAGAESGGLLPEQRVRQPGGGRKAVTTHDPALVPALEALVEPATRGDPMSPLRRVPFGRCKSTRQLAAELARQGHPVSHQTVAELLHGLHYSL